MYDRDEDKIARLTARFVRVEKFLAYLEAEEKEEHKTLGSLAASALTSKVIPGIRTDYSKHRDWIMNRVEENRERLIEDTMLIAGDVDSELWQKLADAVDDAEANPQVIRLK